jgi:hypothetical protein
MFFEAGTYSYNKRCCDERMRYKGYREHTSFFGTRMARIGRIRQITQVRKPVPIRFYREKQR